MIYLIMGITGSGKTTIGRAWAARLGLPFYDADDFHPAKNIARMSAGTPLTDADRAPWLARLHAVIADYAGRGASAVIACSALKRAYRDRLRGDLPGVVFVYLAIDAALSAARLDARTDHYMQSGMIASQLAALEVPSPVEAITLNAADPVERIVKQIADEIHREGAPSVHTLPYHPPLAWPRQLDFLHKHSVPGWETVTDTAYERVTWHHGTLGHVRVVHAADRPALRVTVAHPDAAAHPALVARVRWLFDLDHDPAELEHVAAADPFTAALVTRHPGVRLPRGWDIYETALQAILGQLVSVKQAQQLTGQLIALTGDPVQYRGARLFAFPPPERLADHALEALGTTRIRKGTLRHFAAFYRDHADMFRSPIDAPTVQAALLKLPGIGPWTAEYIGLRALGNADAFPGTDLILKRALERHPTLDPARFRPYRGYLALLLWEEYAVALSRQGKPPQGTGDDSPRSG